MKEESRYLVWLSSLIDVSVAQRKRLLDHCGSAKELFHAAAEDRLPRTGISAKARAALRRASFENAIDEYLERLDREKIHVATLADEFYPKLLSSIYDPPVALYAKGKGKLNKILERSLTVVGTRRCTSYGKQAAMLLGENLGEAGVSVVSGMARGIDSMTQEGCLKSGQPVVAVLGCGVDVIYPKEEAGLYQRIMENGVVLSEFPPGTPPLKQNFPQRNRIMAGLTSGVIVIEAGKGSGALITANLALEENREVFVVPGNITSPQSAGSNALLRLGAVPLLDVWDAMEALRWGERPAPGQKPETGEAEPKLLGDELALWTALGEGECGIEELAEKTGLAMDRLNTFLTILEFRGIIKQLPGKRFVRTAGIQ